MRSGREIRSIVEQARSFTNGSKAYEMDMDASNEDPYMPGGIMGDKGYKTQGSQSLHEI
jgi:hypothetical protein